jgi:hypothetical protein
LSVAAENPILTHSLESPMLTTPLRSALLFAALLLFPIACADAGAGPGQQTAAAPVPSAQAAVHGLKCGCAIESVGKCGNFIEVEGRYLPLKAPIDLGPMAFCEQDGLRARADGQVENGAFVATTFAYVQ